MFDLENQIAAWRQEMFADGIKQNEVLDELESHLRDETERQMRSGADAPQAFAAAVLRIGHARALTREFKKVGGLKETRHRIKHSLMTLAGIPNHYANIPMNISNSNPNVEPAWATYLKAGIFTLPAVVLWLLSCIYVLPQLRAVYKSANGESFPAFMGVMIALTTNALFISGAIILVLVGLEWRVGKWPRYRRAVVGVGAFIINSVILIAGFLMVVLAVIAASRLNHAGK